MSSSTRPPRQHSRASTERTKSGAPQHEIRRTARAAGRAARAVPQASTRSLLVLSSHSSLRAFALAPAAAAPLQRPDGARRSRRYALGARACSNPVAGLSTAQTADLIAELNDLELALRPSASLRVPAAGDLDDSRAAQRPRRSPLGRESAVRGRCSPISCVLLCFRQPRYRGWSAMRCPFCGHDETKVVDSRVSESQDAIRRRRECLACQQRFTTYERREEMPLMVVKKDGTAEPFDRGKLLRGLIVATAKRNVAVEQLEALINDIEKRAAQLLPLRGALEAARRHGPHAPARPGQGRVHPLRLRLQVVPGPRRVHVRAQGPAVGTERRRAQPACSCPVKRLDPGLPLPALRARGRRRPRPAVRRRRRDPARWQRALVPTGIAVAIPAGHAGFVQPRSGLALKHGLELRRTPRDSSTVTTEVRSRSSRSTSTPRRRSGIAGATRSPSSSSSRSLRASSSRSTTSTRPREGRGALAARGV